MTPVPDVFPLTQCCTLMPLDTVLCLPCARIWGRRQWPLHSEVTWTVSETSSSTHTTTLCSRPPMRTETSRWVLETHLPTSLPFSCSFCYICSVSLSICNLPLMKFLIFIGPLSLPFCLLQFCLSLPICLPPSVLPVFPYPSPSFSSACLSLLRPFSLSVAPIIINPTIVLVSLSHVLPLFPLSILNPSFILYLPLSISPSLWCYPSVSLSPVSLSLPITLSLCQSPPPSNTLHHFPFPICQSLPPSVFVSHLHLFSS